MPDLFQNQLYPYFIKLAEQIREILGPIDSGLAEMIVELGRSLIQSLGQLIKDFSALAVKWVANSAISIPNAIIQIVITVVSSFYIAIDYRKVLDFFVSLLPGSKRGMLLDTLQYMRSAVVVYIKSYTIIFFMTFAELAIGLALLKIRYAVPVAMSIAVFDLMPVLGTGGILLPWIVISALLGDFGRAIGIAVLYIVITAVRNTVEPRLVGDQIGLHPLATLVAMILGLKLIGLLGMFLFPVTLVAVMNLRGNKKKPEAEETEMQPVPAAEEAQTEE
jgi:sporulation integral membrane protein YtvI